MRGVVDGVNRPGFTILGVTIQTNAATQFEAEGDTRISEDAFFDAAAGRQVSAKGSVTGGVFSAREVEFEND